MVRRETTRRRRLLAACRWHSRAINRRGHVRSVEAMIDHTPTSQPPEVCEVCGDSIPCACIHPVRRR